MSIRRCQWSNKRQNQRRSVQSKPGNSKYVDVNKDGVYNDADQGIIGCGQPTFNWGWNNTFNYKNFDFSFFVVGFHGFDIYNATHQMGYNLIKSQQMAGVTPMREFAEPLDTDQHQYRYTGIRERRN